MTHKRAAVSAPGFFKGIHGQWDGLSFTGNIGNEADCRAKLTPSFVRMKTHSAGNDQGSSEVM